MSPANRKTSARRRKRGAAPAKGGETPRWLWLATGFALGLLVSFLFHLATAPGGKPAAQTAAKPAPPKAGAAHSDKTSAGPKFDFYTLLPETEVIVPDEKRGAKQPAAGKPGVIYYLQAGSFRQAKQADKRRAQLLLLGLDASVETIQTGGETWHRVQAGPFASPGRLDDARSKLIGEGIDTLVISKRKDAK